MKTTNSISAKFSFAVAALATGIFASSAASAKVFFNDYANAGVWQAYETDTQTYGMKFQSDASIDGFWLVVSDGPNPKTHMNEYAILYGDLNANRITAYTYDGVNSANSYKTGDYLATYENVFSTVDKNGQDMTTFNLDVSTINGAFDTAAWDGVKLGADTAGIWFHRTNAADYNYGADGSILNFSYGGDMWLDAAFTPTIMAESPVCISENPSTGRVDSCNPTGATPPGKGSVPAPGGLLLLATALFGLRLRNRK